MTEFVPMQFVPAAPTVWDAPQVQQPQQPTQFRAIVPITRTIRLDEIAATVIPVPGTVYQYDYFVAHLGNGALERLWIAASSPTSQSEFSVQLVDEEARELTEPFPFKTLPILATMVTEHIARYGSQSVFLRVRSQAQSARLYLTAELLVTEVL